MYKHHYLSLLSSLLSGTILLGLVACGDDHSGDGDGQPAMFTVTVENISDAYSFLDSGVAEVPVGSDMPGPLLPGDAYEISFYAGPGQHLSFATMFVQSNDFFYAPVEQGIPLFDEDGNPISGDVTGVVLLWDAGTEIDQEPGLGMDQAPRQTGADTGESDPDGNVRLAADTYGNLPPVTDVLRATLTAGEDNEFKLRIENVSNNTTLQMSDGTETSVPLAPMLFVLHTEPAPLFTGGSPDRGMGLADLAEDGNPNVLADALAPMTGVTTPLAPGVYAIHAAGDVLFSEGETDYRLGLEALAEDGNPEILAGNLERDELVIMSGVFDTPVGGSAPGPALPGQSYRFSFEALPNQYLSFATMLVQSNDLFFAPAAGSMALFDTEGNPRTGDITMDIAIWNAGTEVDQALGAGPAQAPRQDAPNTGEAQNGPVERAVDPDWPTAGQLIRVTISAEP